MGTGAGSAIVNGWYVQKHMDQHYYGRDDDQVIFTYTYEKDNGEGTPNCLIKCDGSHWTISRDMGGVGAYDFDAVLYSQQVLPEQYYPSGTLVPLMGEWLSKTTQSYSLGMPDCRGADPAPTL